VINGCGPIPSCGRPSAGSRSSRRTRGSRRWSLGEPPQCLNVLRGESILVAPRRFSPYEADRCGPWLDRRPGVQPGITGLRRVSDRRELSYDEPVRLDLDSLDRRSVALDIQIVLRTVPAVVGCRWAF
jgi:lipopolysaccharide/colanic/teichoic acid biosynthesis glycosyltransferase